MSWFSRTPKPTEPTEDVVALRDGVLVLLEAVKDLLGAGRAERAERLAERLARLPPPTGLVRELKQIRSELLLGAGDRIGEDAVDGRDLSRLTEQLAATMAATALVHSGLDARLAALRQSIPRRITRPEVDRLVADLSEIAESSQSIRKRTIEDRNELAGLLKEMGKRLSEADEASGQLGLSLAMVADSLVREPLPDELRSVRAALIARVERLGQDAGALRTQLARAKDRSRALEDMVQQQQEELLDVKAKAALDPLTGACNRGAFDKALATLTRRATLASSPLSLIFLDIDHFKRVNDSWGHPAGDQVLIGVARVMEEQVRDGDVVARIGGEEFALLLPGASLPVARAVAERVRQGLAATSFPEPATSVRVTASFGVALHVPDETPKSLMRRADQALYGAKNEGRNRVKVSEPRTGG